MPVASGIDMQRNAMTQMRKISLFLLTSKSL